MKVDTKLLDKYVEDGWLSKQSHPILYYNIYNYTKSTQYGNHWDEVTLNTRGLIVDCDGNLISRGFPKFFNSFEYPDSVIEKYKSKEFTMYDKLDGSLGISYYDGITFRISTRGSFISEMAMKATEILHSKYYHLLDKMNSDYSYLFEIIYPENRIVIDYGELEDIVLLAILDKTGKDVDMLNHNPGFNVVSKVDKNIKDFEQIRSLNIQDKEGYILVFEDGFRMKLKFDWYLEHARLISSLSEKRIWEHLIKTGGVLSDILLETIPDEEYNSLNKMKDKIMNKRKYYDNETKRVYEDVILNIGKDYTRKDFYKYLSKNYSKDIVHLVTLYHDERFHKFNSELWKYVKPKNFD